MAVNQMSPYSMLVLAETVGVLARCLGVCVPFLFMLSQSHCAEADTASEEQLLQTLTHAQRHERTAV